MPFYRKKKMAVYWNYLNNGNMEILKCFLTPPWDDTLEFPRLSIQFGIWFPILSPTTSHFLFFVLIDSFINSWRDPFSWACCLLFVSFNFNRPPFLQPFKQAIPLRDITLQWCNLWFPPFYFSTHPVTLKLH